MKSHREINYGLRPAKNIERKMICETLQRLIYFEELSNYQYVGFGSRYFVDFTLIHKSLGISKMISIEKDKTNKDWFEFNKPYKCITAYYENSNEVLPKIDWKFPTILWLDYDGTIEKEIFLDVSSFCEEASPGSVILITVNSDPKNISQENNDRYQKLEEKIGKSRIPSGTKLSDLGNNGLPNVLREIIDNEIHEYLTIRNGVLPKDQQFIYEQIFNFVYCDGSQMLTVGGIIYTEKEKDKIQRCHFSDFDFIRQAKDHYQIEVPNLTFREIHLLNTFLPLDGPPPSLFIPLKEINQYAKIYRYFPTFTESEV